VQENLEVGRQPFREHAPRWTLARVFELFPVLEQARDRSGGTLSGGEQQMLTLARTLMGNPILILMDEPSEGMAPLIVEKVVNLIVELKQQGVGVLLSEQDEDFARRVSDRACLLQKGQIARLDLNEDGDHGPGQDPV
jgi:branched-chain amino acid transport system ATP-binding protein